jgi:hypothetical protein
VFLSIGLTCWIIDGEKIHSFDKEGEAMLWFHSWCQEDLRGDWESFSQTMRRFGVSYDSMILDSMRL